MSILTHSPAIVRDGLVLCLDAGAVRSYPGAGPQLVVNGDFASDITTGWEAGDSTTGQSHDTGGDGGRLKLVGAAPSRLYSSAAITLVIGQKYRFSVTVSGTSTNHFVHIGSSKGGNGTPLTNWTLGSPDGTYVHDFVATADEFWIHLGATGSSTQYYDQVSLVAIASNLSLPGGSGYSSGVSYGVPGANQWSDLSGNFNNGTLNNMQYDLDAESGSGGTRSFHLDGTSDYIRGAEPTGQVGSTTAKTYEYWFKMDPSWASGTLSMSGADANNYKWQYIYVHSNGSLQFHYGDNSGYNLYGGTATSTITADAWTHIAVSIDITRSATDRVQIYKNTEAITVSWNGTHTNKNAFYDGSDMRLYIGSFNYADPPAPNTILDGKIACVRIYNRGLTAAEIQQNYRTHKGRFGL